jgi:superfamily II DNA or RNA helicase
MNQIGPGAPRPAVALRPYQEQAIAAARAMIEAKAARGEPRRAMIVLPTGCGKTRTALTLIQRRIAEEPGLRVLWLAHRAELLTQPIEALIGVDPDLARRCGVVQANRNQAGAQIVMASALTLCGPERLAYYLKHGTPGLVIVDEAHRSLGARYLALMRAIEDAGAEAGAAVDWVALTATPERTDRVSLASFWGPEPAHVYAIADAIREGYLCPPRFVDEQLQLDEVQRAEIKAIEDAGDDERLGDALIEFGVVPATVDAMDRHLRVSAQTGQPVPSLVFCANVRQADLTAEALIAGGWRAALLTGTTSDGKRRAMLTDFLHHNVDVIVNVGVLTEGTDLPRCAGIVAARPFRSKPLWLQSVGRGLRLAPGKDECIVVDLAGAHKEHHGVLGVAVLGGDGEGKEAAGPPLPGATYEPRVPLTINGVEIVPGDGRLVRALPVVAGRTKGALLAGQDTGLRAAIFAVGTPDVTKDGKEFVKWERVNEITVGHEIDDTTLTKIVGTDIVRVVKAVGAMSLDRERRGLQVPWAHAQVGGEHVRVCFLESIPKHESKRAGALWVVQSGDAENEDGYVIGLRYVGRRGGVDDRTGQNPYPTGADILRPLVAAPVTWSVVDALAADYLRQTIKEAAAEERWRLQPPAQRQRDAVVWAGGSRAAAEAAGTAGECHDLRAAALTQRDPEAARLVPMLKAGRLGDAL